MTAFWLAARAIIIKYAKELALCIAQFARWTWNALRNDAVARISTYAFCATTLLFAWLWWTKPTNTTPANPQAPVTVSSPVTIFKDRIAYRTVQGVPVTVYVPAGSNPTITPEGQIKVQRFGFCLLPKLGALALVSDGRIRPYAAFRVAYAWRFGLEAGASTCGPLAGVDFHLPFLNTLTISGGISPDLGIMPPTWRTYLGATAMLRI